MPFSSSTVSNLYFWVKGDAGITQSAGSVSAWADQSGNSRDLNVASVTKPTYSATGLNSLPAVVFNHTAGTFLQTAAFGSTLAQPTTIFVVAKLTFATPAPGGMVDGIDGTNRNFLADYGTQSSSILETYAGTAALDSSTGHTTYNNPSVVTVVFDAASSVIRQNGKQVASGTSPGTAGLAGLTVGSRFGLATTYGWDGPIAEVLIYSRHLSASEIGQVEDYLAAKYSIAAGYLDVTFSGLGILAASSQALLGETLSGQGTWAGTSQALLSETLSGQGTLTGSSQALLGETLSGQGTLLGSSQALVGQTLAGQGTFLGTSQALLSETLSGQGSLAASSQALVGQTLSGLGTLAGSSQALVGQTLSGQGSLTGASQAIVGMTGLGQGTLTGSSQALLSAPLSGQGALLATLSLLSSTIPLFSTMSGQGSLIATLSQVGALQLACTFAGTANGRLANGLTAPFLSLTYVSRGAFASVGTYGATPIPPPAAGAKLPAFDPLLQYLGQFCQQVMNAYGSASWVSVVPGTGPNPVRTVRLVRPKHIMFNEKDLPALYLWREGGKPMEWMAEDILCKHDTVRALWLFPTHTQENQQYRTTYIDQLIKIVHACVSTGRDPAFQVPADTQAQAATYGSVLWDWAGLSQLYFRSWERQDFVLPVEGQAARTYEGVQLELETLELFHPDATQYDALGSLDVQILETDPVLGTQIKAEGFL